MNAPTRTLPSPATRRLYPTKTAFEAALAVARTAGVPQIPDVILALRREVNQAEPNLAVVSDLISQDPALTGQLLKTINSAAFNQSSPVTNVQHAATLMGLKRLSTIVTAEAISRMMAVNEGPVRVLWESILETARVMTSLARLTPAVSEDEVYLFAIMHDVGSLVFANVSRNYISEWSFHGNTEPSQLLRHEQSSLGSDHPTVGFMLATHWKLPEHIALAILHHHTTQYLDTEEASIPTLIALSKLGHYLVALSHAVPETPEMQDDLEHALHQLDLDDADWQRLRHQALNGGWN